MAATVAYIGLVYVLENGDVYPDKTGLTIKQVMTATHVHRVLPNTMNSNSDNYPTVADFIVLEDAAGRKVTHLDQYMIVTQS